MTTETDTQTTLNTDTSAEETPQTKTRKPSKRHKHDKRSLWKKITANPIFWIVLAIIVIILFVSYLERYTQIGVNATYKIF